MNRPHRFPVVRTPHDGDAPRARMRPGLYVLAREQTVQEAVETGAYLETHLWLVDPQGGDAIQECYRRSKAQSN